MHVLSAFCLIVDVLRDSSTGAADDTGIAGIVGVEEAVGVGVFSCPRAGGQRNIDDDTAAAVGDAALGDKAIGNIEGAQSGGVSDVPL